MVFRNKSRNPRFFKSGMRANILLILFIIYYIFFLIGWDTSELKPVERTTAALQVGSVKQEPNPQRDAREFIAVRMSQVMYATGYFQVRKEQ